MTARGRRYTRLPLVAKARNYRVLEIRMKKKKCLRWFSIGLACLLTLGIISVLWINGRVKTMAKQRLLTMEQSQQLKDVDCIIVLGCQVRDDGSLSSMLQDRLQRSVELYAAGVAPKLLMSGDHGQEGYNEVGAMKQYAVDNGVPSENVFMDHAGFSTYETIYRAKEVFKARKVVIVTQEYHLYRALYIAEQLGLEGDGVAADLHSYGGQFNRDIREVLARCKDFAMCIFKPEPTCLGEAIPVSGDGNKTNDK